MESGKIMFKVYVWIKYVSIEKILEKKGDYAFH